MAKKIVRVLPFGIFVSFLVTWFLSGKIIPIPYGTFKGGIIAAGGVFTIICGTFLLGYILLRVNRLK